MKHLHTRLDRLKRAAPRPVRVNPVLIYRPGACPTQLPPGVLFLIPDNGRDGHNREGAHASLARPA